MISSSTLCSVAFRRIRSADDASNQSSSVFFARTPPADLKVCATYGFS
jgi:hypothetical protein